MPVTAEIERRAAMTIAGACAHMARDNRDDAVALVRMFLDDMIQREQMAYYEAMECLGRAGITVSLLAAEPDPVAVFDRVTIQLLGSDL